MSQKFSNHLGVRGGIRLFIDLYYECSVKLSMGVLTIYKNSPLSMVSHRPNVENPAYEQSD